MFLAVPSIPAMDRAPLAVLLLLLSGCSCSCLAQKKNSKPFLVSLTLAGNSERIIADALASAVAWVDAAVLIDTGITDGTIAVAEAVAGSKLSVKQLPWPGSFSEARNAALRTAEDMGASWAVFLDTDERFEGDTSRVRPFLKQTAADLVNMTHNSLTYAKPRFYRLPLRGEYIGPTHEAFMLKPGSSTAEISGVVFSELPKDEEVVRRKAQRDVGILVKHTAEHPTEPRWWYYLGDAYAVLGRHEEAVRAFHNCTALRGWDEEGAWAMYRAAASLEDLKRYDEAIEALANGMTRHPAIPELPWYAGYLAYHAGHYQAAAQWARLATVHGCYVGTCPQRVGFEVPHARFEGPYDVLRWSLRALGDEQGAAEAERHMQLAISKRQGAPEVRSGNYDAVSSAGRQADAGDCAFSAGTGRKPRIGLGFTTARRPTHFMRTYLSFRARCLDCSDLVDEWYAVDDGSSEEELAAMKAVAPNIKWLDKADGQAGHVGSINALLKVADGYDYFVWMEDDWLFVRDDYLVSKAVKVLDNSRDIAQVLFNRDYMETDHDDEANLITGGGTQEVCGIKYVMHKYCGPVGSAQHTTCSAPGKLSNFHWPHFSLRPGVWNMRHMHGLGPIQAGKQFEHQHGLKYVEAGLKTAFLPGISAIHLAFSATALTDRPHIAAETYARHGIDTGFGVFKSAYDLRGTVR